MSKIFHLENIETGERWKKTEDSFIVLYDSGRAAKVTTGYYPTVTPIDHSVWKIVFHENLRDKLKKVFDE